jgi:branched-chain amino acid transport system ATP-binding protein
LLDVKGIDLQYGDALALQDVSIAAADGEIIAIIGANGAGKTSLIKAIAGIQKIAKGRITYRGHDITGKPSSEICNLGIGQVAEGRQIFPSMSVLENLEMGAVITRARDKASANLRKVYELYPVLAERRNQVAGTLSGGEQQMLAIGRCLMGSPDLIMFDEPSLGLAPAIVQGVFRTIRELNKEGMSIILVEQNVALSLRIADRAYVLENGHITISGTGAQLLHDDRVRQAYMGI